MTRPIKIAAFTLFVVTAPLSLAHAWERNGTLTGKHGTSTTTASGGCSGGVCSRSYSRTGPKGATVSRTSPQFNIGARERSRSCSGGTCTSSITNGYGFTRTRSISR
ncbi:MAG: hypothetical protein AAGC81_17005 [Pseudomonadota bacterium]